LSTKGELETCLEAFKGYFKAGKGLRAVVEKLLVGKIIEGQPSVGVCVLSHLEFVEVTHSEALVVVSDDCVSLALLPGREGIKAGIIKVVLPEVVD